MGQNIIISSAVVGVPIQYNRRKHDPSRRLESGAVVATNDGRSRRRNNQNGDGDIDRSAGGRGRSITVRRLRRVCVRCTDVYRAAHYYTVIQ